MRLELSSIEYTNLFSIPVRNLRFSMEELSKMLESRLDSLTKHVCENDLNNNEFKSSKLEIMRCIEGFELSLAAISEKLRKNVEKSFEKIEELNAEEKG